MYDCFEIPAVAMKMSSVPCPVELVTGDIDRTRISSVNILIITGIRTNYQKELNRGVKMLIAATKS